MRYGPAVGRLDPAFRVVRSIIVALAVLSGIAIFVMIGTTVIDVVLRIFGTGITGAYDIVRMCGVVTISCGLPYITAVKGHIAIEFFYHHFSRRGRVVLDTSFRAAAIALFALLAWKNVDFARSFLASGEMMPTLGVPVFWMPLLISLNCVLVGIVILYHLLHPGKEMIKP